MVSETRGIFSRRELNTWADELTYPIPMGFDPRAEAQGLSADEVPFDATCVPGTLYFKGCPP